MVAHPFCMQKYPNSIPFISSYPGVVLPITIDHTELDKTSGLTLSETRSQMWSRTAGHVTTPTERPLIIEKLRK